MAKVNGKEAKERCLNISHMIILLLYFTIVTNSLDGALLRVAKALHPDSWSLNSDSIIDHFYDVEQTNYSMLQFPHCEVWR